MRLRILVIYAGLAAANLGAWVWALTAFRHTPVLLGTALLAYGFGLRHAIDADHIAAIDNVTRALMQQGKRPVGIGLFFSLGHSSVVALLSAGVAVTAGGLGGHFAALRQIGDIAGTLVSAGFLLAVALMNLAVLASVRRAFLRVRGGAPLAAEVDAVLAGGPLTRLLRPAFRLVGRSWHMFPLGFLFGLGFDTATEVGLLGISAVGAAHGMPVWSILIFPALFTAGMSLVDATDSILMLGAYGWAFADPLRKLYYNMTITLLSVLVALFVGGVEVLGLAAEHLDLRGPFWAWVDALNSNFGLLGYAILMLFGLGWGVSVLLWRLRISVRAEVDPG